MSGRRFLALCRVSPPCLEWLFLLQTHVWKCFSAFRRVAPGVFCHQTVSLAFRSCAGAAHPLSGKMACGIALENLSRESEQSTLTERVPIQRSIFKRIHQESFRSPHDDDQKPKECKPCSFQCSCSIMCTFTNLIGNQSHRTGCLLDWMPGERVAVGMVACRILYGIVQNPKES